MVFGVKHDEDPIHPLKYQIALDYLGHSGLIYLLPRKEKAQLLIIYSELYADILLYI